MRILHLASGREWRGGQRQTWFLTRGLGERGVDQQLLTRKDGELARRAAEAGVPVIPVEWSAGLDPRVLPPLVRAARRADIIHAHDSHAVALASAASRFTGTRYIATRRMTRPLQSSGPWRRAARLIAISDAVRRSLLASGIAEANITIVTPAIDVRGAGLTPRYQWSQVSGIPPEAFVAVAVSALTSEKGIDLLVDAMADSRVTGSAIHTVIAGDGPERATLEARTRALPVPGHVHFLGHVSDPLPLIGAAGVLVIPSREEAFGSTILDALALGIPVIGADAGGIPEALSYGGGVTFRIGDASGLATEMHRLATDPEWRGRLSRNAAAASTQFDLPGMVEATLGVYRSVMENVDRQ